VRIHVHSITYHKRQRKGRPFHIVESLPPRRKVPRAGRVCCASALYFHQWQVLWRDLHSSSATHFILGLDTVKLYMGVALVAVDS